MEGVSEPDGSSIEEKITDKRPVVEGDSFLLLISCGASKSFESGKRGGLGCRRFRRNRIRVQVRYAVCEGDLQARK